MKKLTIGTLPITNQICIGTVKNGIWQNDRVDVTDDALWSVVEHLLNRGAIQFGGKYKLSVEVLDENQD